MKVPPPKKRAGQARSQRRISGEIMDVRAVAEWLGVTEDTVRARTARGLIPSRKWRGRIIFIRSEVMGFLIGLPGIDAKQALENNLAWRGE